ncbi:MAG: RNA 2',3'-cyclic phosphodiesterase [Candidatus Woesearchaeota archaeon]
MAQDDTRSFIAVELPDNVVQELKIVQQDLRKKNLFIGKLTEPENIHLTLKFLGELDKDKLEKTKVLLSGIRFSHFSARIGKLGVFSDDFVRIIWASLDSKELCELQKTIDAALSGLFPKDSRFASHITIARVKKVNDRELLFKTLLGLKIENITFNVPRFVLKSSELTPEGPVYSDIEKYSLA